MNQPLVTIALAVYNAEDYLRKCLESICNQTYRHLEILCVNDGSTDGSLAILEEYAARDSRIKIISQLNGGLASVRNVCLEKATGKYLQMLDSDDFFEADMVRCMVERAEEQNADIVVCASVDEHQATGEREHNMQTDMQLAKSRLNLLCCHPSQDAPCDFFQIFNWGVVWDKLFKLEFIHKHKLRFHGLAPAEDIPFVYPALILARRVSLIDSILIHYQVRALSLCHNKNRDIDQMPRSFSMLWDFMQQHGASQELRDAFVQSVRGSLYWNVLNVNIPPSKIISYINDIRTRFPFCLGNPSCSTILNAGLRGYEALFCPEITLLVPQLSADPTSPVLRALQFIVDPGQSNLATRVLYASEDGNPLPFELLDYPVALPVQVPHGATADERMAVCRALPLPPAALELWPGCNPELLYPLIRHHKRQLLLNRVRRIFALNAETRKKFKIKTRIYRKRLTGLLHLLEIIQSS